MSFGEERLSPVQTGTDTVTLESVLAELRAGEDSSHGHRCWLQ